MNKPERLPHPDFADWLPASLRELEVDQTAIPRIAKDAALMREIEAALPGMPTRTICGRAMPASWISPGQQRASGGDFAALLDAEGVHRSAGQMGDIEDYEEFLTELDKVWQHCFRALVPGGRLVCVVGDVCLSRRKNERRHTVVPLHASIQEHCRRIGFDNLSPIIWHKIANAVYEVDGTAAGFSASPTSRTRHQERHRVHSDAAQARRLSQPDAGHASAEVISAENHHKWFQQIWTGLTGASTRHHPAPYPLELAERLIRMFSFVGDTVLDPFMGTGTTNVAAAHWGRNSIGVEVDPDYFAGCQPHRPRRRTCYDASIYLHHQDSHA